MRGPSILFVIWLSQDTQEDMEKVSCKQNKARFGLRCSPSGMTKKSQQQDGIAVDHGKIVFRYNDFYMVESYKIDSLEFGMIHLPLIVCHVDVNINRNKTK